MNFKYQPSLIKRTGGSMTVRERILQINKLFEVRVIKQGYI
jgi:hypothetical protein